MTGLRIFPQRGRKFCANGFLAIRYIMAMPPKFFNILTVQKIYSALFVVFRMLPAIRGVLTMDNVSVKPHASPEEGEFS
jgi:hypothetical protein